MNIPVLRSFVLIVFAAAPSLQASAVDVSISSDFADGGNAFDGLEETTSSLRAPSTDFAVVTPAVQSQGNQSAQSTMAITEVSGPAVLNSPEPGTSTLLLAGISLIAISLLFKSRSSKSTSRLRQPLSHADIVASAANQAAE